MRWLAIVAAVVLPFGLGVDSCAPPVRFVDATREAGFDYVHDFALPGISILEEISGGVAAGDVDGNGFVDLFVVRGTIGPSLLFLNFGEGQFTEGSAAAGLALEGRTLSGPAFADWDGDGDLDLFVGGVEEARPRLFENDSDGRFNEVTEQSGLAVTRPTFSAAFGDLNRDGALDLFLTHWSSPATDGSTEHLFVGDGEGGFQDASIESGISQSLPIPSPFFEDNELDFSFTPNLTDIDRDGWLDVLLTSDFGTSQVLRNRGDGTFEDVTPDAITDENGMGAAIGDYDNDGDLDWFVTSIWDPDGTPEGNWGVTGNRLYRNDGNGHFEDATDEAGVRVGFWGWGACFADFDNDGNLDLFHVNGLNGAEPIFGEDPSRLFLANGDGSFREASEASRIDDFGNGRGVVCFDADRDGDIDLFVANTRGAPRFFRNETGNRQHWLGIRVEGPPGNTQSIGAWVTVKTRAGRQLREIRAGSHFVSSDPAEAHFGLGNARRAHVFVRWPDGTRKHLRNVRADQHLVIEYPEKRRRGRSDRRHGRHRHRHRH